MFSLICGIITTSLGVIMFPFAAIAGKGSGGAVAFVGFIAIFMFITGLAGIVTSSAKLLATDSNNEDEKADRKVATKGLWFSVVPVVVWMFFMVIGSM